MTNYIERKTRHVGTLTTAEQRALLVVSGKHRDTIRDHIIFSMALATGLRVHEITALNMGDIFEEDTPKQHVALHTYKTSNEDEKSQTIILSPTLRRKLKEFYAWKKAQKEPLQTDMPLFLSQRKNRLSIRQVQTLFTQWQKKAGFERHHAFHNLRHTACTNIYDQNKDILLAQRFARHKSINYTMIYTHASDEVMLRAVSELRC